MPLVTKKKHEGKTSNPELKMTSSNIFISTTCLKPDIFTSGIPEGVRGVEFSGGFTYRPVDDFRNLIRKLKASGINVLIHGYFPPQEKSFILNFASKDNKVVKQSLSLAGTALSVCAEFGIPYYSFHPGYMANGYEDGKGNFVFDKTGITEYADALSLFRTNFEKIYELSKKHGVRLAVENLFINRGNVKDSLNNSFEEIDELMSLLPADVGLLLDFGHMNVSANYMNFSRDGFTSRYLEKFGQRLFEIHLSENNGDFDTHDPLTAESWQLDALKKFRSSPGATGKGINVTLESRKIDDDLILKIHGMIEKAF